MVYPLVVITFASLVLIFMLMFIIPVFVKVFDQLNGDLPKPTQIIVNMSNVAAALVVHHLPGHRRRSSGLLRRSSGPSTGAASGIASSSGSR